LFFYHISKRIKYLIYVKGGKSFQVFSNKWLPDYYINQKANYPEWDQERFSVKTLILMQRYEISGAFLQKNFLNSHYCFDIQLVI